MVELEKTIDLTTGWMKEHGLMKLTVGPAEDGYVEVIEEWDLTNSKCPIVNLSPKNVSCKTARTIPYEQAKQLFGNPFLQPKQNDKNKKDSN